MNKWAADPAENQTQEHHLPQTSDFPRDRLNDNKGVGRGRLGRRRKKNEYLTSTERTFQLKNPGCCVKAFSPWKGGN